MFHAQFFRPRRTAHRLSYSGARHRHGRRSRRAYPFPHRCSSGSCCICPQPITARLHRQPSAFCFPHRLHPRLAHPNDGVEISRHSFLITIGILAPAGFALDFFFAHLFFRFPNSQATLQISAPALGDTGFGCIFLGTPGHVLIGSVPIEEYIFYLTGFITILLLYIWLDEYWLAAYSIPVTSGARVTFDRLLRFHPSSLFAGIALLAAAILYRHFFVASPGFPGYFTVLVIIALGPSTALFPSALPVINWRALSLALFFIVLISLLWEATLATPYGWWAYQHEQMVGIFITAWSGLPLEAICVWVAVTYQTVILYEVIRRWKSSGKSARRAFLG